MGLAESPAGPDAIDHLDGYIEYLHREMKRMADAGMKPYDILRSGSYNVGVYLKEKDNFGTIELGKRADLILLDANPLVASAMSRAAPA